MLRTLKHNNKMDVLQQILEDLALDLPDANPQKLTLLCKKAVTQINNYLNTNLSENSIYKTYKYAIEQIVLDTYMYQSSNQFKTGATMIREGNSSVQYTQNVTGRLIFSEEVKALLPKPFAKLIG